MGDAFRKGREWMLEAITFVRHKKTARRMRFNLLAVVKILLI
jgi:hypothetical protein